MLYISDFELAHSPRLLSTMADQLLLGLAALSILPPEEDRPVFDIATLSGDLLYQIWTWVIGPSGSDDSYEPSGRLAMSQVCRRWREISVNSPLL